MRKYLLHVSFLGVFAFLLLPMVTLAGAVDIGYVDTWVGTIRDLVADLIPLLIGIAVLLFIWGLVTFIASADDEAARAAAKTKMVWGIIAIFVIVGVWGFVELLQTFTGIDSTTAQDGPGIPTI